MAEQDFSEIARLSERYNKDPKSRIFVQLADAYRKNNMIEEALDILNKGLEHHPRYPLAHLILGKCHLSKRQFAQAKASFEKTLSFDSQNVVALRMLAKTCESMKDEVGQISALKGLLALDPFDTSAKEKLAQLEALQKEPLYTMSMAQEYEKQGDLEKALSVYEHLLFTDPTDLVLQQKVKELKAKSGKTKQEIEEEKIAELQVDSYFQIDDLKQKEAPLEPTHKLSEAITPEPPHIPTEEEPALREVKPSGPDEQKSEQEEQILSLEDFLVEETPAQPEPKVAEKPTPEPPSATPPPPEKPETPPAAEAPTPEHKVAETPPPEPIEEIEFKLVEDLETPSAAPPPAEKPETPPVAETPTPEPKVAETPPPEPAEEIEFKLAEEPEPPSAAPPPAEKPETPPVAETPTPEHKVAETPPPEPAEEIEFKLAEEPEPPSTTPAEKPEEKKEEPGKPKEEDFQSFKDWLSGLLK